MINCKELYDIFIENDLEIERSLLLRIEAVINTRPASSAVFESRLDAVKQTFLFD